MEKWLIKSSKSNIYELGKTQNEKIIYRIIANRGINTEEELATFLDPDLSKMYPAELMKDMVKATEILLEAIDNESRIRIVGDYDVDGIMSTYILYRFIKGENFNTDYKIPHRIDDGYGINKNIVDDAIKDGINLIITVDNGISAIEPILYANENGIKVIVLDHHEPKIDIETDTETLPNADAIVDHKCRECGYPFKGLCGAAIAYKFIELTAEVLGYDESEIIREYLEFAAIATICDVMDLVDENRIIVANGLKLLNNTSNLGLKTLINESGLADKKLDPYHIGFIIGPTFNASGRLDSAYKGVELLLTDNFSNAQNLARELRVLNQQRTEMTIEGLKLYLKDIEANRYSEDKVIVSFQSGVHESIAGIIAGRVKEKYNRPTIILTESKKGAKGSGRSIEEYNMVEGVSLEKDLLNSFGGHKMACGVSLDIDKIKDFRDGLNNKANLVDEDFQKKVFIDLVLPINYINTHFIEELDIIGPFGNKNPRPVFGDRDVTLSNFKILGKNQNVLRMTVSKDGFSIEGIMFDIEKINEELARNNISLSSVIASNGFLNADIVYQATINEWNGNITAKLNITSVKISR